MRGGDDDPVRAAEIEHQHHQAAGEQRQRQQAGQRRACLIDRLAEHRTDRGDVEHAGGGDDHEDGKHVRHAPDDLVGHAGDGVAVFFHVMGSTESDRDQQRSADDQQPEVALFEARETIGVHDGYRPW